MIDKSNIINLLKEKKISVTKNRIKIIECLKDHGQHFHTINDIVKHSKLNTKSIYNNIKSLIFAGLVDSLALGGVVQYAWNDNLSNHNHKHNHIHTINSHNDVFHENVDIKVFDMIKKELKKKNKIIKSIQILVNIE